MTPPQEEPVGLAGWDGPCGAEERSASTGQRSESSPRLAGWAAHPGDLNTFTGHLSDAGIAFDGPTPGERRRRDGWKTLHLDDDQVRLLPFFIERSPDTVHPSADAPSGCKVLRFELSAPNDAQLRRICTLLGLDVPIAHGERPRLLARIAGPGGRLMELSS